MSILVNVEDMVVVVHLLGKENGALSMGPVNQAKTPHTIAKAVLGAITLSSGARSACPVLAQID